MVVTHISVLVLLSDMLVTLPWPQPCARDLTQVSNRESQPNNTCPCGEIILCRMGVRLLLP